MTTNTSRCQMVNTVQSVPVHVPSYLHRVPRRPSPSGGPAVMNETRAALCESPPALLPLSARRSPPGLFSLVLLAAGAQQIRLVLFAGSLLAALGHAGARQSRQRSGQLLPSRGPGAVIPPRGGPGPQHQQELDDLAEVCVVPTRESRVVRRVRQTRYRSGRKIHEILALCFHHCDCKLTFPVKHLLPRKVPVTVWGKHRVSRSDGTASRTSLV